jgi:hypothetical protein
LMEYVADEDTEWKIVDSKTGELKPTGFFLE